ncbi:hypothetical protein M068_4513 [Bacteroides fragilis str. J38-1]|nr:hypothetical protein M068_4513 [Bacteroides fragilis str. J38-1]
MVIYYLSIKYISLSTLHDREWKTVCLSFLYHTKKQHNSIDIKFVQS